MVLLEISVGLQTRYIRAAGLPAAIRAARADGVPEWIIRDGTAWTASEPSTVGRWADVVGTEVVGNDS